MKTKEEKKKPMIGKVLRPESLLLAPCRPTRQITKFLFFWVARFPRCQDGMTRQHVELIFENDIQLLINASI
jgi:hypothetical protein